MSVDQLIAKYEAKRSALAPYAAQVDAASLLTEVIEDLHKAQVEAGEELLTLQEAAVRSGYSPEHLRRLVREDRLPATHKGRRLFFRAGDLPRKPAAVDHPRPATYDPLADARQLSGDRAHGRNHGSTTNG